MNQSFIYVIELYLNFFKIYNPTLAKLYLSPKIKLKLKK